MSTLKDTLLPILKRDFQELLTNERGISSLAFMALQRVTDSELRLAIENILEFSCLRIGLLNSHNQILGEKRNLPDLTSALLVQIRQFDYNNLGSAGVDTVYGQTLWKLLTLNFTGYTMVIDLGRRLLGADFANSLEGALDQVAGEAERLTAILEDQILPKLSLLTTASSALIKTPDSLMNTSAASRR